MDPSMYLDEGLLAEILKRLPVDVLYRLRCVCKWWNSLISSSSFVRAQYLFSSSNSVESKPFILFDNTNKYPTYFAFYNPDHQSDSHHRIAFQTVAADDYDYWRCLVNCAGVVHGVVCLSLLVFPNVRASCYTVLWNPTIRRLVKIRRNESMSDVGFGFDGSNIDFKVIRTDWSDVEKPTTLEVYSYRKDRSRTVDSDHIGPFDLVKSHHSDHSCFKNGVIHWIIRRRNWPMATEILMFDCKTEELKTMELPQLFNQHNLSVGSVRLFVRFGKLSVWVGTRTKGDDKLEAAVWVMDEYGVATSWKKTAYNKDPTRITRFGIRKLMDGCFHTWTDTAEGFKRSQLPWNGYVFEPSMLLMDAERVTPRWLGKLSIGDVSFRVIDE